MGEYLKEEPSAASEFWAWFEANQTELSQLDGTSLDQWFASLGERLRAVDPDLVFEFSASQQDEKHIFVISGDGIRRAFPAVIQLVESAPSLSKWEVIAFRQAHKMDEFSVEIGGFHLTPENVKFSFVPIEGGLELHLYVHAYDREQPHHYLACMILLDGLLGEYDVATKIRFLEIKPMQEAENPESLPAIETLPMLIEDLRQGRLEGSVPLVPQHEEEIYHDPQAIPREFAMMQTMMHQKPNLVLINPHYFRFAPKQSFPWLLVINIEYPYTEPHGLPDSLTLDHLDAREKEIVHSLNQHGATLFIYRSTWNGLRQIYLHMSDWTLNQKHLTEWISQYPEEEISFEIAYERDWESVRAMLYHLHHADIDPAQ